MAKGFQILPKQTVVFMGDSITDAGRRGHAAPFGEGYVQHIIDLITGKYPGRGLKFLNVGISGETTNELRNRWTDDVIVHKPDWLSLMIGINDCHRFLFHQESAKLPPARYRENYLDMMTRTVEQTKARIILMDPFYVSRETETGTNRGKVMGTLGQYIRTVREMAKKFHAIHIPLHDLFQEQMRHRTGESLAGDAVHPSRAGQLMIAQRWLEAVGW